MEHDEDDQLGRALGWFRPQVRRVETYVAMTSDTADARALLKVAPGDYVAERTRLAKEARVAGDRSAAAGYLALKRPNLALWAVLAAGDDADAVRTVVTATADLAKVQSGGSDVAAMSKATQHRRKALESLVDTAVKALARFEPAAEARRAEIRGVVDQLSRREDLADAWLDGTLRDLPDDSWGFGAFADLEVTAGARSPKVESKGRASTRSTAAAPEPEPRGPTRAARAAKVREARGDVTDAKRALGAAERRLDAARKALREAEKEVRLAEKEHEVAERRHQSAAARLQSAEDS